jgi:hypothetical protein
MKSVFNLTKVAMLLSAVMILPGCVIHVGASNANVHLQEELQLSANQLEMLEVDSGAGSLTIIGDTNATDITVSAEIHTTEEKDYQLVLVKKGSRAVLTAEHGSTSGFWNGQSPSIDLTITVPAHLALEIDDGSGGINIKGINNHVDINDGSGELVVKNVQGNLTIEDGSGELTVDNVSGDVVIDDGSGEMIVKNISGSVSVIDGSGDLSIHHVGGKVSIDDGSGGIDVLDAGGLNITESGSGGLQVKDIKGEFNIDS